jgi:hypothetical protein
LITTILYQARRKDSQTYAWKAWDGTVHGDEDLLVDNYLALLAVYIGYLRK